MNYRHAFHAGNFADVVKHIVLTRILIYLHDKPTGFRVIDTHAGSGRYDLRASEARRSGEWRSGIGRLLAATIEGEAASLIAPYLDIVRSFNLSVFNPPTPDTGAISSSDENGDESEPSAATRIAELIAYPGSPLIARALLRPQDRLVACEIESKARAALIASLRRDTQARVVDLDGWMALKAFVPPQERRGLVLIDPPYEARDEFERVAESFTEAFGRWPTGSYLIWYPVKDPRLGARLARHIGERASDLLRLEISIAPPMPDGPLATAGLLVVNPPWTLARDLRALMPAVAKALGQGELGSEFRLDYSGR